MIEQRFYGWNRRDGGIPRRPRGAVTEGDWSYLDDGTLGTCRTPKVKKTASYASVLRHRDDIVTKNVFVQECGLLSVHVFANEANQCDHPYRSEVWR